MKKWIGILACVCTQAWAGSTPFLIIDRASDLDPNIPAEADILDGLNTAADDIEDDVNNGYLRESLRQIYVDNIARASTSIMSGLMADYASNPRYFTVGFGAQAGLYNANGGFNININRTENELPPVGVAGQAAIVLGVPGKLFGLGGKSKKDENRWMFYLSGMTLSRSFSTASASVSSIGFNAQYKIIEGRSASGIVGWGGVSIGTGIGYSKSTLEIESTLNQEKEVDVNGESAIVNINMDYRIGAQSSVITVPFEVSTNASLLYFLTLYGGAGVDLNFGSSKLIGTATGPITAEYSQPLPGIDNLFSGTGALQLDDGTQAKPAQAIVRSFVGLQFNFYVLKFAAQYAQVSNGTKSGTVLCRFAL